MKLKENTYKNNFLYRVDGIDTDLPKEWNIEHRVEMKYTDPPKTVETVCINNRALPVLGTQLKENTLTFFLNDYDTELVRKMVL